MLQSLGVSSTAEALYLILAPLETAGLAQLAELTPAGAEEAARALAELQSLGLARPSGADEWQALPLLDAVHALRLQRVSEIEAATAAAESMQSRILAASRNQPADNITVLIGTDAIVEARDSICDSALKEICAFDKPPYVQARPNASPQNLTQSSPEWRALERGLSLRCVYHPGFDADRLAELALFADRGEKSPRCARTNRARSFAPPSCVTHSWSRRWCGCSSRSSSSRFRSSRRRATPRTTLGVRCSSRC
jgi:hypothetical protein